MKRRHFIRLTILLVVAAIVSFFLVDSFDDLVRKIVRRDTEGLLVDDDDIDRFVADARADGKWNQFSPTVKLFIRAHYYFGSWLPLPYRDKYIQQRSFIVRNFLLSTDFFKNNMDVTKRVQYRTLNHPYRQPCANPFSNIYYDANAVLNGRG